MVSRADKVDSVYSYAVYKGDEFQYSLGVKPDIHHVPGGQTEDDALTHVYSVAHIKGSTIPRIEVMSRTQVDAIRKRSQAGGSGPWVTDYAEMARKTVTKKLCKTLPLSAEIAGAIAQDETYRPSIESADTASMFELPDTQEAVVEVKEAAKVAPQEQGAATAASKKTGTSDPLFGEER